MMYTFLVRKANVLSVQLVHFCFGVTSQVDQPVFVVEVVQFWSRSPVYRPLIEGPVERRLLFLQFLSKFFMDACQIDAERSVCFLV